MLLFPTMYQKQKGIVVDSENHVDAYLTEIKMFSWFRDHLEAAGSGDVLETKGVSDE
jgi:hypothetical protein